jgi:hypothetical protein
MSAEVIAFFIVGGLVTGLIRFAVTHMDETEPTASDKFWVRAPATLFFVACLFVGGYFVLKALHIIVYLVGG